MTGHGAPIEAVRVSPDGRLAASADVNGEIWIWDLQQAKAIAVLRGHNGAVYNLKFSKDGKSLFSAGADRSVREWNVDFETDLFSRVRNLTLD